jgi:ABC-type sugar transport system ATPase subunit
VVHQDYNLFPDLTIAENVLGVGKSLPRKRWTRTVDKASIEAEVAAMLERFGIDLAPDMPVRSIGPAERKFVEIVRALRLEPRFLILDEPTASLEPEGSRTVLDLMKRLRDQGLGVAFVSHRLGEVVGVVDEITVLRDGALVANVPADDVTEAKLAELIVGRQEEKRREAEAARRAPATDRPVALRLSDVRLRAGARPVDLDLHRGEILGLTGLLGSGAATVTRMLGGAEPLRGWLEIDGRKVRVRDPREAKRLGIGFIPEDRKARGVIPAMTVAENISLASLGTVTRAGLVDYWAMRERAEEFAERFDVRPRSVDIPVGSLSGGNLQKVLLAKWLATDCEVLAIEEPTHGIDIGGKVHVHKLLREFVSNGGTIVVALSEVDEALELCDRIAVFRHGELVNVLSSSELTHSALTLLGATDQLEHIVAGDTTP